ncbi:MAG: exodeoxyribonuclease VII large subunit [Alphaproteobacteria bacterium]
MQEEIDNSDDFFRGRANSQEYSVSEISQILCGMIEDNFNHLRIRGEISGLKIAASGHIYFNLKDQDALINAICWRGTAAKLDIRPEEGLEVTLTGRITTYAQRSNYQIIVEHMELTGEGALLKLLEDRKKKLATEGLFDEQHKKPLPFIPKKIAVVTSPTGAVIRDILHRIEERFPTHILVWPTAVQGKEASKQIAAAIFGLNELKEKPDLIIIARGGGSLEDLWCFNEEDVVRAIFVSEIPIISAVGHETDITLADFAADKRAPTPTAAAEIAVPVRKDIYWALNDTQKRLSYLGEHLIKQRQERLKYLSVNVAGFLRRLETYTQRLDLWEERLNIHHLIEKKEQRLASLASSLKNPAERLDITETQLKHMSKQLQKNISFLLKTYQQKLHLYKSQLSSLSHRNILQRGYALISDNQGHIITKKMDLPDKFTIHLQDGKQKAAKLDKVKKSSSKTLPQLKSNQGDLFD